MNSVEIIYDEDKCIYDITPFSYIEWEELHEYLKLIFQLEDLEKDCKSIKYTLHLERIPRNLKYKSLLYAIQSKHERCNSIRNYRKEIESLQQFT